MFRFMLCVLIFLLCACGKTVQTPTPTPTPTPPSTQTIPAGPGEWVFVEKEIPLETINTQHFVLPYGAGSTGRSLKRDDSLHDPKMVIRYQVVAQVELLTAHDRCNLQISALQAVHLNGAITEFPVTGHVIDNSDDQRGFRVELSLINNKQLVIPAHSNATVVFDHPVTIQNR